MQIYTNKETDRELEEIKEKIHNFNASEEFRKLIRNIHSNVWAKDLEKLRIKHIDILEREKQIWEEKKLNEEKIREAEIREPERKKVEEEKKRIAMERREEKVSRMINLLLYQFNMDEETARGVVEEYLLLSDYEQKQMDLSEFAVRKKFRLSGEFSNIVHNDNELYHEFSNKGYKFK